MNDFLAPLLVAWGDFLWRVTWQGTVAMLIALLIEHQWKSLPPSWRNWLWRFAFLKIAVAAIPFSIPLPVLPVSAEPAGSTTTSNYVDGPLSASPLDASPSSLPPLKLLLFSVWLIGLSACAISSWESGRQVRRKLQKSTPTQANSLLMQSVRAMSRNLGLTVIPEVRLTPGSSSPCLLTRNRRSIILLPKQWLESCAMSELRVSLAHELAHMARGDLAWNRLILWSRAVLFFHPLVWIAMRRYLLSQEIACDSIAIANTGGNRADFARLLVQLAENATAAPSAAVAMIGSTYSLKERIASMYQAHYKPAKFIAWVVTTMGVFGLMPFALAEQAGKSERTELTVKNDAGGPKVSASANASSRGSGSASGLGVGAGRGRGNGDGNQWGLGVGGAMSRSASQSSGRASVSISRNAPQGAQVPATRPEADLEQTSSMKQSMSSRNRGGVATWTRTTEATLNGDNVTIVEKPNEISLTIVHADGSKEDFVANDLRDLASQSRSAAAIYRKLLTPVSTAGSNSGAASNSPAAANSVGSKPLDARDLLREQIQSMKGEQGPEDAMLDRLLQELDALGN